MFFASFDRIVAVSPALYTGLAAIFRGKVTLIRYGVRDKVFFQHSHESRITERALHAAHNTCVVFIFLGSIGRRKGFDLLAQAFADLAPIHGNWRLWVIGPRTRAENQNLDEDEVSAVTRALKQVEERVTFLGRIDDRAALSRILSSGDVFLFPSRQEGMPIAPMEAMAAGLPLIMSRIQGVTDQVSVEGETGLYIPPGDLASLKAAMFMLGTDKELCRRMGERAATVVRDGFGWEQHITNWINLYEAGDAAPTSAPPEPAAGVSLNL
jgi:glycosyltransferase involved in cell wall biosynthesis